MFCDFYHFIVYELFIIVFVLLYMCCFCVYVSGTAKTGLLEVNDVASKNEFKVDVIFLHLQLNFNYKIMISIGYFM